MSRSPPPAAPVLRNPSFMLAATSDLAVSLGCFSPQIFEYNGSAVVAMVGKNCFAIASDRRLGVQLQTIATDFQRVFKVHDKLYIGLSGLATDAQTLWVSRIHDWFGLGASIRGRGVGRAWFRVWV